LDGKDIGNITLLTNGLLIPRYWDSIHRVHDNIDIVSISIDAATKETYERMRLGGKWEDLQESLALVKNLPLKKLLFNFVICRTNFKEMVSFAKMAREFGAHARFSPIRDWRVSETFAEEDISNPAHPDHSRLLEVKRELADYENHIRIS
jgi:molybdenum cofactor biosynthesis enzyme MoaA